MEVVPCVQKAGSHAASLLERLNLQRERAQFCDCVVRQRQNPSQLYPAHRCVLAASSPVLASILSSSSALVELQAPCLSDSVLALVLDFMYTGDLPSTHTQQQYYNLLTAACHLQMDELQKTLRTEVNPEDNTNAYSGAEDHPHKDINNAYIKTANIFRKYLPLSDSPQIKDQYCDGTDTCRSSGKTDANHHSRKDARPLSDVRTGCGVAENTGSVFNIGNYREITPLTPQELISCTTVVNVVSRLDKEMQKDHFHSVGTVKPECWQMITEEGLVKTVENRRSLYLEEEVQEENMSRAQEVQCLAGIREAGGKQTNRKEDKIHHSPPLSLLTSDLNDTVSPSQCSSSSLHPCGGAVPVIRHSGTATMAEVSTTPPYHPVSKVSVNSGGASDSGSTDSDRIAEGVTTKHKSHYRVQSQDYKYNKNHTETQSWYHSDQCIIQDLCYKSNVDQSDILKQDYNSSNTDHDEHMGSGLSHIVNENDHCAHCDSFQNKNQTKCLRASVPLKRDLSSFNDFPTKYQQLDCSDCCNVSIATAAEEQSIHSQDLRVVVHDADAGSDSHCEDLCPKGEVKEENSFSSKCPAEMDRYDSHWNLYGPRNDGYPSLHSAETSTKDAGSSQHEHDNTDTDMDNVTGEHCTSLEHENISGTEISESHPTFTMPVDNNVSDPSYTVVGQSYCGHLRYHCLPQENTHLRYGNSDRKHSYPGHAGYSDQSSDVDEADTVASPGLSPLRKHFATTDQILLLDISTKSAELLVSYRQRPDEQEKRVAFSQRDTSANELGDNDREQRHEATSVAGVDKRQISARTKTEAKIFNEAVALAGETNGKERKSVSKEQIRPRGEVIHKAGVVEDENQAVTALTVCSPPRVSDSVQAPVPSSSPGCIASTLSASMPTNKSAPLSTPVHHLFQCSLCSRSFSQRGSLNRHVRSHLGVRPFPCPRCPMTFSRQYRVSEHMRVHQRCVLGIDFQKPHAS